jgi:aminopeptidase-like protein
MSADSAAGPDAKGMYQLIEELYPVCRILPDRPDWVPYRTSYYNEIWEFCLSQRQRESLVEPEYDVHIDSSLTNGSLTYGEAIISGRIEDEVLLSTHVCHPSLANDNSRALPF